ncbi:MAG: hypothetical protein GX796_01315 [Clostridiaceae bacterium]|nr:hypothetical protein [Clostridiaceae bacterium]
MACIERDVRNLGVILLLLDESQGRPIQSTKRTANVIMQEFGLTHSTLRTGKPFTWGRG